MKRKVADAPDYDYGHPKRICALMDSLNSGSVSVVVFEELFTECEGCGMVRSDEAHLRHVCRYKKTGEGIYRSDAHIFM